MTKRRIFSYLLICVFVVMLILYATKDSWYPRLFEPTESNVPSGRAVPRSQEVVAKNLNTPWHIALLPNGDMLVTERSGTLKRIGEDGRTYTISGVTPTSEGGLLGLALHPDFSQNRWLYVYLTTQSAERIINRVERYRYSETSLSERTVILDKIPGSANHDGGRIAFGPDGLLYISTGDASNEQSAQDTAILSGKILRITDSGKVPSDNPFGNPVYSYGHRNPQGLAWDAEGQLWSTEHGRSGARSGYDELNRIKKGANYGWPVIEGDETRAGMEQPVAHSGADDTWAPASLAYKDGSLYFGGLRGQSLYEARVASDNTVTLSKHFTRQFGRLRAVTAHSDGYLYVGTSNRDGRGNPAEGDDKIIRFGLPL